MSIGAEEAYINTIRSIVRENYKIISAIDDQIEIAIERSEFSYQWKFTPQCIHYLLNDIDDIDNIAYKIERYYKYLRFKTTLLKYQDGWTLIIDWDE